MGRRGLVSFGSGLLSSCAGVAPVAAERLPAGKSSEDRRFGSQNPRPQAERGSRRYSPERVKLRLLEAPLRTDDDARGPALQGRQRIGDGTAAAALVKK